MICYVASLLSRYAVIVRELDQVLTKSIAGAMEKVEEARSSLWSPQL